MFRAMLMATINNLNKFQQIHLSPFPHAFCNPVFAATIRCAGPASRRNSSNKCVCEPPTNERTGMRRISKISALAVIDSLHKSRLLICNGPL